MKKQFNLKTSLRNIGYVLSASMVSFGIQAAATATNNSTLREAIIEQVIEGPSINNHYCANDYITFSIQNKSFNNDSNLTVSLGHKDDKVRLILCSQAVDTIEMVSERPNILGTGDYWMEVFTNTGVVDYDAHAFTVGAFGQQGIQDDTRSVGTQGLQEQGNPNLSVAATVSSLQVFVRRNTRFRVPFNTIIYQDGGTFGNGSFGAPTDGVYYIRASMSADIRNDNAPCQLAIMKSEVGENVEVNVHHQMKCRPDHTLQVTTLVALRAGQRVWAEYFAQHADTELRFMPERNSIFINQLF